MATAEELLNSVLKNEASVLSATDAVFVIDGESRTINVPDSERLFGVEGDKDVERKYFKCPKIVGDNIDLSQHQIYVSYAFTTTENSTSFPDADGLYHCEDVEVSGDNITFSWLLSGNVFANPGFIAFKVMAKKSEGEELKTKWNTAPAIGSVLLTVPDGENIAEEYPDVINQILDRLDAIEESGSSGYVLPVMTETKLGGGKAIAKTTESVPVAADENGQLWVPEQSGGSSGNTVSVEVESTTTGEPGTDASVTNTGDSQNVKLAFVIPKGETGETGSQGPAGATGATPNIQIGTVQTLDPGQQATASMTGTPENPLLNLGIPKGEKGDPGGDAESGDSYTLPIMSSTQLGGGKAVSKTDEDVPVAVDPSTGQLFVPTYPENTGGDTINVDAEMKEYMNVAKPAIASAIINKGGSVEPDDSLNDYATRISAIPNDVYPAETLPAQTNLSASGLQEAIGIKLNWSNVNASGYLILRKENAMPATSADGDIVYNGTYAAGGYTDTGVQKGKVYYYRIFPRNSKNQYQSLEDGAVAMVDYKDRTGQTLLGDLPLETKIKFGQWNGSDFFWEIVDTQDKASGFVTVAADQNLGNRPFDAPEPSSPISNRKTQGNNRWAYSAARQLLNSDADADAWWTSQYEYDVAPSYATQIPGFLKDFTTYEKGIVVTKTNKCILPNDDGGGTETVKDKFWLPSYYAMGLGVIQPLEDDHIYEKYTDNASRSYQSHYWLRSINGAESPSNVLGVNSGGYSSGSTASNSYAVRPFCQLPTSAYMTWSDSDEAYVFADDSQRNPSAS